MAKYIKFYDRSNWRAYTHKVIKETKHKFVTEFQGDTFMFYSAIRREKYIHLPKRYVSTAANSMYDVTIYEI